MTVMMAALDQTRDGPALEIRLNMRLPSPKSTQTHRISKSSHSSLPSRSKAAEKSKRQSIAIEELLNPVIQSSSVSTAESSPTPSFTHGLEQISEPEERCRCVECTQATLEGRRGESRACESKRELALTDESSPPTTPPSPPTRGRSFRAPYDKEQSHFVWFHKDDLNMQWSTIKEHFDREFPGNTRPLQGLQCKYYRHMTASGVDKVRDRTGEKEPRMWPNTRMAYKWMIPYADQLEGFPTEFIKRSARSGL